jgi:hypothetical protein
VETGKAAIEIDRRDMGFNREEARVVYVLATLLNPTRIQLRNLARVTGTWVQPDLHWFAGGWIELGSGTDF